MEIYIESGNPKGPLIVMLSGYPDNHESAWGPELLKKLSARYRLLTICLPQCNKGNKNFRSWGFTFPEMIERIYESVREKGPFFLVGHDWGALLALQFQNLYPFLVKKVILLDVGMLKPTTIPFKNLCLIILYQWWFAFAYIVSQLLSVALGNLIYFAYFKLVFLHISPSERVDIPDEEMTVLKCYPYFQYWKAWIMGRIKDPAFPSCPVLFMVSTINMLF
jgi:pimeloyl-ACP methyl ester carboxylesterase